MKLHYTVIHISMNGSSEMIEAWIDTENKNEHTLPVELAYLVDYLELKSYLIETLSIILVTGTWHIRFNCVEDTEADTTVAEISQALATTVGGAPIFLDEEGVLVIGQEYEDEEEEEQFYEEGAYE